MAPITSLPSFADACPSHPVELSMAVGAAGAVLLILWAGTLRCTLRRRGYKDHKCLFHCARIVPWTVLMIFVLIGIVVETYNITVLDLPIDDFGRNCMSTGLVIGFTCFAVLLVSDLIWLTLVFRTLHKKPFLFVHHVVYLAWVFLTIAQAIEYVRLIFLLVAVEESQEIVASLSWLRKNSRAGALWLYSLRAWRLVCSSFAIGLMCPYLLVPGLSEILRIFIAIEILLWGWFLYLEFWDLCEFALGPSYGIKQDTLDEGSGRLPTQPSSELNESSEDGNGEGAATEPTRQ